MLVLTMSLVPLTGLMTVVTPFLMRRGEVFAVTVPDAAARDPYLRSLKRRYAIAMLGLTAILTAVGAWGACMQNPAVTLATLCAGTLLICACSYGLMLFFRAKVNVYKKERGWKAEAQESVAVVGDAPVPRAVSLKWNLLYVPVMAVTLLIGAVGYAQMPDLIPQHVNFQGEVTDYMEKSPVRGPGARAHSGFSWRLAWRFPIGLSCGRRSHPTRVRPPRLRWRTVCSRALRAFCWWWAA